MKRKGFTNYEILITLLIGIMLLEVKLDVFNTVMNKIQGNYSITVNNEEVREAVNFILLNGINTGSNVIDTSYVSKFDNIVYITNGDCGYDIYIDLKDSEMDLTLNTCNITEFNKFRFEVVYN